MISLYIHLQLIRVTADRLRKNAEICNKRAEKQLRFIIYLAPKLSILNQIKVLIAMQIQCTQLGLFYDATTPTSSYYLSPYTSYCRFGNFREHFIFANSIKRHISDGKNSRLRQYLRISINDRVISPFREGFIFTKLRTCEVSRK